MPESVASLIFTIMMKIDLIFLAFVVISSMFVNEQTKLSQFYWRKWVDIYIYLYRLFDDRRLRYVS